MIVSERQKRERERGEERRGERREREDGEERGRRTEKEKRCSVEDRKNMKCLLCLTLKGNIGHVPTALNVGWCVSAVSRCSEVTEVG